MAEPRGAMDENELDAALRAGIDAAPRFRAKPNDGGTAPDWRPLIKPIDWPALEGRAPPPRAYVVRDWLPAGVVTSLYGTGGVGKSLLAQQLGAAVATGTPWLGRDTTQGRVLALWCEDDEAELWRRQARINASTGTTMTGLAGFLCDARPGRPNELVVAERGVAVGTDLLDALGRAAADLRPSLVTLDCLAQLFGANENDRAAVTSFVNRLTGLALECGAAVLLLGHTPKNDAAGHGFSGSTAWNAAVRSRWLLDRDEAQDSGEPRLTLRRLKSNYAPGDDTEIPLVWRDGVLRPADPKFHTMAERLEAEERKGRARQAFKDALDRLRDQGIAVSDSPHARETFAPRYLAENGLADGCTLAELRTAMRELLDDGTIRAGMEIGRRADRKRRHGLGRTAWLAESATP